LKQIRNKFHNPFLSYLARVSAFAHIARIHSLIEQRQRQRDMKLHQLVIGLLGSVLALTPISSASAQKRLNDYEIAK
jgi:hypothetical protein